MDVQWDRTATYRLQGSLSYYWEEVLYNILTEFGGWTSENMQINGTIQHFANQTP